MHIDSNNRPNYIDLAKVVAIYAVILGHFVYYCGIPFTPNSSVTKVTHFVTLFHMPFFFMVTGIVSSFDVNKFTDFAKKQFKTLLVPYLLWCFILSGSWTIIEFIHTSDLKVFPKYLIALISGSDFGGCRLQFVGPMWFVYALFFIKLIIGLGFTLKKKILKILYFGVLFAGGEMTMYSSQNPLPFRIDCILVGLLFVFIGFKSKSLILKIMDHRSTAFVALCISSVIIALFECFYIDNSIRQGLSINTNYYGKIPILFLLSGLSGSIMILSLSRLLFVKKEIILTISNGLLSYLAMHWTLYFVLSKFFQTDSIWGMFGMSILVFILLFPITLLIKRFFPILLGYRK